MQSHLVEPGARYFFNETLKQCRTIKHDYYNSMFNLILSILFIFVLGSILVYTYNHKENSYEKKVRLHKQEEYLANTIQRLKQKKQRERGQMITNIPEFESKQHIQMKKFL